MSVHIGRVLEIQGNELLVQAMDKSRLVVRVKRGHLTERKKSRMLANLGQYLIAYSATMRGGETIPIDLQKRHLDHWNLRQRFGQLLAKQGLPVPAGMGTQQIRMFNNFLAGPRDRFMKCFSAYEKVFDARIRVEKTLCVLIRYISHASEYLRDLRGLSNQHPAVQMVYLKNYKYMLKSDDKLRINALISDLRALHDQHRIQIVDPSGNGS